MRSQAVLLLLCSMLLLHFGSIWIYDKGLRGAIELTRDGVLGDRLATAGLSIMEAPRDERDHVVHRFATPGLRLHWAEVPALTSSDVLLDARTERLRQRLILTFPPERDPAGMRELSSLEGGRDAEETSHGGADHRAAAAG